MNTVCKISSTLLSLFLMMGIYMVPAQASSNKEQYKRPLDIPFPEHLPYSPQLATLGKMLFFDPRLSGAKDMTCASCHNPSFGFEVPIPIPAGARNTFINRQAPTTQNLAWSKNLPWDGWSHGLEEHAIYPVIFQMDGKFELIVPLLRKIPEYKLWFNRLFPEKGIDRHTIAAAIATYERTIVTGWAPFDHWIEGDERAISKSAKRGFELFTGKAGCAACHQGWNFTDNDFHDIGVSKTDKGYGLYQPDKITAKYAFKTPSLRNLTQRAPYMHNGSIATIDGVLGFYQNGGIKRRSNSPLLKSVHLTEQEQIDIVNFLKTLTSDVIKTELPILPN